MTTIWRHSPPNKYDEAPFGTHCKVLHEVSNTYDLYIQYSKEDGHPKWELIEVGIPVEEEK
jgi:hypothetical protein